MITVIDYNMGNLRSVSKALEHLGAEVCVSSDPHQIINADKLVLPGVGAFGDACAELRSLKLFEAIQAFALSGKPFLGICLGLQLLFTESEESPGVKGLGIFPGTVRAFRSSGVKIPHMGWNTATTRFASALMKDLPEENYFYFVHSFYAVPNKKEIILSETEYGQEKFPAILACNNIFATQFHPEKSQSAGLQILKNFIAF